MYLNVKLVPFFAFVLLGRKISVPTWVSAFTALTGTGLLAYDGGSLGLNVGDAWSIAAAAASAMFLSPFGWICIVPVLSQRHR